MKELISVILFMCFITFNLYATTINDNYLGVPMEVLEHNPSIETRHYPDWVMFIEKKLNKDNKCIIEGQVCPYNKKYGEGSFRFPVDDYRWDTDIRYKQRILWEINLLFEGQYKNIGPKHWRRKIC
jgi:hypothetical protein